MVRNKEGLLMESPIHHWFGLTYSSYFVAPRVALEAMPLEWQEKFVELMDEAEEAGFETPDYHVLRNDPVYTSVTKDDPEDEGSWDREFYMLQRDPWANYRHPDKALTQPNGEQKGGDDVATD